jgi:hypothetical protein
MSRNVKKCKNQGGMHAKGGRMQKLMERSFPFITNGMQKKEGCNLLIFKKKTNVKFILRIF